MGKTTGYILMIAGVLAFLASYPAIRTALKIPSLGISDFWLMVIGIVILLIGAFLGFKGSGKQAAEVPIYHGDKIVGYRRMK